MKRSSLRWNGLLVLLGLLAQGVLAAAPGQTQHLASPEAVPEGLTSSDWASIRAAYQAHRHEVVAVEGGYRARNPGQQWRTDFDERGFVTRPDMGGWQWGLELKSYGFPGQKREIRNGSTIRAEGDRVIYLRDAALREWLVNDPRGLEHGFTLEQAPAGADDQEATLEFDLAVRGNLRPELSPEGGALRFVDAQGGTVLTYSELKVWDAEGRSLPARFLALGDGVRLIVDARVARYPVTVDPLAQQAYVKASNTGAGDQFGISVAVSGDTVVVGAFGESSNATGVNGDQSDNSATNSGAAYVFVRAGMTWTQQAYLKASNTQLGDRFGRSVAVSGDTVVVGANLESSNATGINGDQSDNSASAAGAAYVFVRAGTTWTQQAYVKASNTGAGDQFGFSAAVSGDTVVVGAYLEDSSATGINGNQSDNSASGAGATYVFVRAGTTWTQQAYLKASNTGAGDQFGRSVAVSGDTVVVGAFGESSNATGINGDQSDNSASGSGAAYVFVRAGTTWTQQAYLKASNTGAGDQFGFSAAVSGDTVVVGANLEDSSATGINGDDTQNSATDSGATYIFTRLPTTLANISTRLRVETGDNVLIGGFIITGTEPKPVLVRAIGPSLPLAGSLADPILELHNGAGILITSNDNWMDSPNKQEIIDTTIPPPNDLESAILATLDPGAYTAIVRGVDDTTGIALVEAYDLDTTVDSELANISTRGLVQTGDNVMIGGFILLGTDAQEVLVRAIGPSLPLAGTLADPTLELYDGNGVLLASNDNWRDTQEAEIMATMIPPTDDAESAILQTLAPAAYTAIVRGANDTTGVALVEVYNLGPGSGN